MLRLTLRWMTGRILQSETIPMLGRDEGGRKGKRQVGWHGTARVNKEEKEEAKEDWDMIGRW